MLRRRKKPLTRREIVAKRQADAAKASKGGNFRRSVTLNRSRQAVDLSDSERQAAWRLRLRRRRLARWLMAAVLVAGLTLLLLTQLAAKIEIQTPNQISSEERQQYLRVVEDYYQTRPIERLRFMVDQVSLNAFFLDRVPEVKSVGIVGGRDLASATLQLAFRQPVAEWSSGDVVYFVDESGVTFRRNYFDTPSVIVNDMSGVVAEAGQEVINRRFLSFLGQSVALFRDNGLSVTEAALPPSTVRQVNFKLQDRNYIIKMVVDRSASAQVSQALKALKYIDEQGISPEYVDVRVDQRVFYR